MTPATFVEGGTIGKASQAVEDRSLHSWADASCTDIQPRIILEP